ncbi:MAG: hypothetical protein LBL66_11195 [Clostridiales bacterium]|nr:hypothetical protein [Clostridiales bacterium]
MTERGRGAFPCLVEIAASRFALLAMTKAAFRAPRNDHRDASRSSQRQFAQCHPTDTNH